MEEIQAEAQARVSLPTPGDDTLVVRDSVPPAIPPTQPQPRRRLLFEHSDRRYDTKEPDILLHFPNLPWGDSKGTCYNVDTSASFELWLNVISRGLGEF